MPQYSNTQAPTRGGLVVNAVLNSETNQITYTVTASNGATASITADAASLPGTPANTESIGQQLTAAGVDTTTSGLAVALRRANSDVRTQASQAEAAATATNTPVPENPAPPPSTNNATDPAVAPAPNNTPPIQSPSPPALVIPAADAALNKAADDKARADYASANPTEKRAIEDTTGLTARQLGGNETEAERKFEDSFVNDAAGVDEQVAEQKTINENTTGQAVVAEDGTVNPNIKINPETGELYVPAGDAGIDDQIRQQAEERRAESTNPDQGGASSNKTALRNAQAGQTEQTAQKFKAQEDWRVRLSLAPGANYLYKVGQGAAGILNPLQATDGVIFPYTPAISVSYNAGYDATEVTHSNYKFFSYKNSNVDNVTITADFTAQDTAEAQYLLAVIHFFRSVTKMFYGKDPGPGPGVPPPLCYLNGLGSFQFDWHPLVINNFTYTLPTDVDYIRAMDTASRPGVNVGSGKPKGKPDEDPAAQRMAGGGIQTGALAAPPQFKNDSGNKDAVTYVPTKMSITIQAYPIVSRNDVSNNFSLKEYATGKLLRGSQRQSGGFW